MRIFVKSLKFAITGIKVSLLERNMKIHLLATLLVIVCGFLLKISTTDWCILLLCISSVITVEILNTAFERTIDLISPEYNERAGKIKDLGAAAVLVVSIFAIIIGLIIFIKPIINFF